jgi:hypothetical protein
MDRWAAVANDATRAMVRHLARALDFYRWRWGIVVGVLLTLVVGFVGGRALYLRMSEASDSTSPPSLGAAEATAEPPPASSEFEEVR